jgi:CheY-like chemotaxis protein/anti-sigma regulatory factor (Ser/Thr protein kinase)
VFRGVCAGRATVTQNNNNMKILIVEDDRTSQVTLSAIVRKIGHTFIVADNGQRALELFTREQPTLVLMDVLMPVMDGHECARRIKQLCGTRFVPIIFLTGMTDDAELAKCIESGGDDFLSKPYNYVLIKAKIEAMERIYAVHETVAQQKAELERQQLLIEQEISLARHVFNAITVASAKDIPSLRYWTSAVGRFSGDLLVYERSPAGQLHILFGDFTGHGLASAIGAIPTSDVFFAMTKKGFSITEIAVEINKKLNYFLPTGLFCAAGLISVDTLRQRIEVWNGGLPPVIAIAADGSIVKQIASTKLPLGVLKTGDFDSHTEIIPLTDVYALIAYSDGLIEAQNPEGRMLRQEGLEYVIHKTAAAPAVFCSICDYVTGFIGEEPPADDISLLEIRCDGMPAETVETPRQNFTQAVATHWSIEVNVGGDTLQKTDPLPILMNWLMAVKLPEGQRTYLYTVLTELINNAIEHGLLGLDSSIKATPAGFEEYYLRRNQGIQRLQGGYVVIRLEQVPVPGGRMIKVMVKDSGTGFDFHTVCSSLAGNEKFSGRGIALARSLCSSLQYKDAGNIVEAEYSV